MRVTDHRYHAASDLDSFLRKERNANYRYDSIDCPGIGTSRWEFPVIKTLLSIPFSLLYNLPRLAGLVPLSTYQQRLVTMGSDIIRLWWWEPSPAMIKNQRKYVAAQNDSPKNHALNNANPNPYISFPLHSRSQRPLPHMGLLNRALTEYQP